MSIIEKLKNSEEEMREKLKKLKEEMKDAVEKGILSEKEAIEFYTIKSKIIQNVSLKNIISKYKVMDNEEEIEKSITEGEL